MLSSIRPVRTFARAAVELDSGTKKYQVQADDAGVYQFSNLPAGNYTLTIRVPGFSNRTIKSIGLLEREPKRLPDVTLDIGSNGCGGPPSRDLVLLHGALFGRFERERGPACERR